MICTVVTMKQYTERYDRVHIANVSFAQAAGEYIKGSGAYLSLRVTLQVTMLTVMRHVIIMSRRVESIKLLHYVIVELSIRVHC